MSRLRFSGYFVAKFIAADALRGQISTETIGGVYVNKCVQSVVAEILARPDGTLRMAVVNEALVKNRRTVAGIAFALSVGERTVSRYTSEFVYAVMGELGFWKSVPMPKYRMRIAP